MITEPTDIEKPKQLEKRTGRIRDWVNVRNVAALSLIVGSGAGGYLFGSNRVDSQERAQNRSAAKIVTRLQTCRSFVTSLTTDPGKKLIIDLDRVSKSAQDSCFIPSADSLVDGLQKTGSGEDFSISATGVDATVTLASAKELDKQIAVYQEDATFNPKDGGPLNLPGAMGGLGVALSCMVVIGIDSVGRSSAITD